MLPEQKKRTWSNKSRLLTPLTSPWSRRAWCGSAVDWWWHCLPGGFQRDLTFNSTQCTGHHLGNTDSDDGDGDRDRDGDDDVDLDGPCLLMATAWSNRGSPSLPSCPLHPPHPMDSPPARAWPVHSNHAGPDPCQKTISALYL